MLQSDQSPPTKPLTKFVLASYAAPATPLALAGLPIAVYLPMSKQGMYNLFQLVNALYEHRSLILTTNKDFTSWHEFFFDDNVAVPIVDRIIHRSRIFILGGESYRLRQKLNK